MLSSKFYALLDAWRIFFPIVLTILKGGMYSLKAEKATHIEINAIAN